MPSIIYQKPEGGVAIVIPAGDATPTAPEGVVSQVISSDLLLPIDRYFRDAWTWEGPGKPVLENLDKAKEIALQVVKTETIRQAREAADHALFDDPLVRTADEVKASCSNCMDEIKTAEDPYEVKLLMCAFCGQPEPGMPRDEQLRVKAEEAKAKLKGKLIEITEATKDWYEEKVPTVGTMPVEPDAPAE